MRVSDSNSNKLVAEIPFSEEYSNPLRILWSPDGMDLIVFFTYSNPATVGNKRFRIEPGNKNIHLVRSVDGTKSLRKLDWLKQQLQTDCKSQNALVSEESLMIWSEIYGEDFEP